MGADAAAYPYLGLSAGFSYGEGVVVGDPRNARSMAVSAMSACFPDYDFAAHLGPDYDVLTSEEQDWLDREIAAHSSPASAAAAAGTASSVPRNSAELEAQLNALNAARLSTMSSKTPGVGAKGGTPFWTAAALPMVREANANAAKKLYQQQQQQAQSGSVQQQQQNSGKICVYFLQGNCRYGDACLHSHEIEGSSCSLCGEAVAPAERRTHALHCAEFNAIAREKAASVTAECTICLENIVRKGQRFGLLSHCAHAFCLPCVREWRDGAFGAGALSKSVVRACPACRVTSHFVIPCDRLVADPERKAKIAEMYRAALGRVPCKYFNPKTKADCPFGSSCFYSHLDASGNSLKETVPRLKLDAEGQVTVLTAPKMSDFIDFDSLKKIKTKAGKKRG